MPPEDVDRLEAALLVLLDIGAAMAPAVPEATLIALAKPLIASWIRMEAGKLKAGLASGALVPDGRGGIIPASNSRYNKDTGEFL